MDLSDKELLDQFANEETRNYAFNLLVRHYQKRLYCIFEKFFSTTMIPMMYFKMFLLKYGEV